MNKLIFKLSFVVGIFAFFASSCQKKMDDVYANPNADARVPSLELLPPIISSMAANGAGHGVYNDYRFFGKYIQNWAFVNSGDMYDRMSGRLVALGSTQADMTGSTFRVHYFDLGINLVRMIQWAEEEGKYDLAGIGKAIQAWSWLTITDVQGEVILKEAFKSQLTYKYDTQEEAYIFARQKAHEAVAYLSRSDASTNPADLARADAYMFGGDKEKWKKFAYAILARSFNHLTNKSTYNADSVITYCDLALAGNADNALVKFAYGSGTLVSGTANFYGPLRSNLASVVDGTNSAIRQGAYIANLMNGSNSALGVADPRAIYMLRKNAAGTFKGVPPNRGQSSLPANDRPENFWGSAQTTSTVNTAPANDNNCRYIFRNNAPLPVIIVSEVKFMKAEAALRKGDQATALSAYSDGISMHMDFLRTVYGTGVSAADSLTDAKKAAYLAAVVPSNAADLTLTKIMLQKYIALFGIGVLETWTDMRRYHYTDADPATGQQVYAGFVAPSGTDLHPGNEGKLVQRAYPRYNSETVWNIEELRRIGADRSDFHTFEQWFSKP